MFNFLKRDWDGTVTRGSYAELTFSYPSFQLVGVRALSHCKYKPLINHLAFTYFVKLAEVHSLQHNNWYIKQFK